MDSNSSGSDEEAPKSAEGDEASKSPDEEDSMDVDGDAEPTPKEILLLKDSGFRASKKEGGRGRMTFLLRVVCSGREFGSSGGCNDEATYLAAKAGY
ncbi:hypothetical protein M885DRAFT_573954, partial [Pelagophyceae sp. CCMP2097]